MITITTEGSRIVLDAPYHPNMPKRARALGGRFDGVSKTWSFDVRDEERVRAMARDIYGTDGSTAVELVTVRVNLDVYPHERQTMFFAGRKIAHRPGRDYSVRLGDGVVVVEGGFPGSGGSMKNPALSPKDGTVLEIRDLPRTAVEAEMAKYGGIEIVEESGPSVEELLAERERLLARLAEIDQLLPEPEGVETSTREAAQALGVSVRTVQRWAQAGKVQARKDDRGRWIVTITVPDSGRDDDAQE